MRATVGPNVGMKSTRQIDGLTIGEVAHQFGLATHVLRHWEVAGLLAPARNVSGERRYRDVDLYRVAAILHGKKAGLALEDIRAMISGSDPEARADILHRRRDDLTRRLSQIEASLTLIEAALQCQHGDIATCPHFQTLLAERSGKPAGLA